MGILDALRDNFWPETETKSYVAPVPGTAAYSNFVSGIGGIVAQTGQQIDLRKALGVSTVFACVRLVAQGMAQVPCKLYRLNKDGGHEEARDHPLWRLLYRQPNMMQTSFEFREQIAMHLCLAGNAFVVITRDDSGRVLELLPFEPGFVRLERQRDFSVRYWVRGPQAREVEIPARDMWHLRGPAWTGWQGEDILSLARESVGLAAAAESFGSEMFANGVRLTGHLEVEGNPAVGTLETLRETWAQTYSGTGNRLQTAVLSGGIKFIPHEIKADEAQYIETRRFLVPDICRFFGILPIMVGHTDGGYVPASVEQMFLAHRVNALGPLFERFEQSAECTLLNERERQEYEIELVQHVLTPGTSKERAETLAIMRQNGVITANQFREQMDMSRENEAILNEYTPAANLFGPREPGGSAAE